MTKKDPRLTGEAWKTTDRKNVEAVLNNAAATGTALTPRQIASLSNVELTAARAIIKTLVTAKLAINVGTAQQPRYRRRNDAACDYIPTKITNGNSRGSYRTNYPIWRPGATDHEALPSRMGAKLIYRNGTVGDAS